MIAIFHVQVIPLSMPTHPGMILVLFRIQKFGLVDQLRLPVLLPVPSPRR